MCISDWRLGRLIRTQINAKSLTSGQTISVPANPARVGIILAMSTPQTLTANVVTVTIDGVLWGHINGYMPQLRFHMNNDGDITTRSFLLTNGTITQTLSITELLLPESILAENLNNLMRPYP